MEWNSDELVLLFSFHNVTKKKDNKERKVFSSDQKIDNELKSFTIKPIMFS